MPLLESVIKEEKFRDVVILRVDIDKQKDFLRENGVRLQSTLIVFKGREEKGRSIADLNKDIICRLFAKGL